MKLDNIKIPGWIANEIKNPLAMGEGRNNQMIRIAPSLIRLGISTDTIRETFLDIYDNIGSKQEHEIDLVLKNSAKLAKKELPQLNKRDYNKKKIIEERLAFEQRRKLAGVLEKYACDVNYWTGIDIPNTSLHLQRILFLTKLFKLKDVVWIGNVFDSGEERGKDHFKLVEEWLNMRNIPGEFISQSTYTIDALSRCDENVIDRKYLVIESDFLTKNETCAVFRYLEEGGLTLRAIVDTGGKSLHGWFDWPGSVSVSEWKAIAVGLRCDPATFRYSIPVRLPGIIRKNTKRPQHLMYLK